MCQYELTGSVNVMPVSISLGILLVNGGILLLFFLQKCSSDQFYLIKTETKSIEINMEKVLDLNWASAITDLLQIQGGY